MPYAPELEFSAVVDQPLSFVHILSRHGICESAKPSSSRIEQPIARLPEYALHDDGIGPVGVVEVGRGCDLLADCVCAARAAASALCAAAAAAIAAAFALC